MTSSKVRLTVTIDPVLARAAVSAVVDGAAPSLSAWINDAIAERVEKARRLRSLREAIASYEEEFGAISTEEIERQERMDRAAARVVRGPKRPRDRSSRTVGKGAV